LAPIIFAELSYSKYCPTPHAEGCADPEKTSGSALLYSIFHQKEFGAAIPIPPVLAMWHNYI
jgi:hypothetical protein